MSGRGSDPLRTCGDWVVLGFEAVCCKDVSMDHRLRSKCIEICLLARMFEAKVV